VQFQVSCVDAGGRKNPLIEGPIDNRLPVEYVSIRNAEGKERYRVPLKGTYDSGDLTGTWEVPEGVSGAFTPGLPKSFGPFSAECKDVTLTVP
jgi:hypothetical protein